MTPPTSPGAPKAAPALGREGHHPMPSTFAAVIPKSTSQQSVGLKKNVFRAICTGQTSPGPDLCDLQFSIVHGAEKNEVMLLQGNYFQAEV